MKTLPRAAARRMIACEASGKNSAKRARKDGVNEWKKSEKARALAVAPRMAPLKKMLSKLTELSAFSLAARRSSCPQGGRQHTTGRSRGPPWRAQSYRQRRQYHGRQTPERRTRAGTAGAIRFHSQHQGLPSANRSCHRNLRATAVSFCAASVSLELCDWQNAAMHPK